MDHTAPRRRVPPLGRLVDVINRLHASSLEHLTGMCECYGVRPTRPVRPTVLLTGYKDIFRALAIVPIDSQDHKAQARSFRRLCRSTGGPVTFRDHRPPVADRDRLVAWWNDRVGAADASEAARQDRKATVSRRYTYGRKSVQVVPEISGHATTRAN